jgi:ribosomal protein S10
MMPYNLALTIKCKNKKTLYYLSLFISNFFTKYLTKNKKAFKNKNKFTLLKSPHVHKSAQHEFKQFMYKKQFLFVLFDTKILVMLKKIFSYSFQDINKKYDFFIKTVKLLLDIKLYKINNMHKIFFSNSNQYKSIFSMLNQKPHKVNNLQNYFKILNFIGKQKISS